MGRNTNSIDVRHSDDTVNTILSSTQLVPTKGEHPVRLYYSQSEDQFVLLDAPLSVPALPIHHPMDKTEPPPGYCASLATLVSAIMERYPSLLAGTHWFFNPVSIHNPGFYRIERFQDQDYLYLCFLDLSCRPLESEITEQGSNDRTHAYRSRRLYFECDYLPLSAEGIQDEKVHLAHTIPITWKGESGEGYMVHGIWMDSDINKFFSKMILPTGKRNHPYYPVTCKQHCVALNAFGMSSPEPLHRIREFIEPRIPLILRDLQMVSFSPTMGLFTDMKKEIPEALGVLWNNLTVRAYLNELNQKEYSIEL